SGGRAGAAASGLIAVDDHQAYAEFITAAIRNFLIPDRVTGRELRKINTLRKFALSSTAGNRNRDQARVDRDREPELRDALAQSHRVRNPIVRSMRYNIYANILRTWNKSCTLFQSPCRQGGFAASVVGSPNPGHKEHDNMSA